MKNHEMVTLLRDDQRLAELEKTIAKGKKTFVAVGLCLAEIRDLRLYRREYGSFSEYCQVKWGWTRRHADRLIEAAPIAKSDTRVSSLRASHELARVEPEDRDGIVQAIVDEGKPVTAAEIKKRIPPVPVRAGRATNAADTSAPLPTTGLVAPLPPPPAPVVDGTGWPIPTQLIPLWLRTNEVQELLTSISRVKGSLRDAQEKQDKLFTEVNFSSALSQLEQAWADIKTAKPFAVCPTCQGQLPDQCALCRGRGLISEHRWDTCVTREDKEFRNRAKAESEKRKR